MSHILIVDIRARAEFPHNLLSDPYLGDTRQWIVSSNWMKVITFDNLPHADIKYVQCGVTGDKSGRRCGILSKNNSILFMRITVQTSGV